jgi:hypothetical protein
MRVVRPPHEILDPDVLAHRHLERREEAAGDEALVDQYSLGVRGGQDQSAVIRGSRSERSDTDQPVRTPCMPEVDYADADQDQAVQSTPAIASAQCSVIRSLSIR